MKKIYFLRTAPYNYQLKGMDLYDSFNAVATRTRDVSINKEAINFVLPRVIKEAQKIFSSPAKRSVQTARLFGKPSVFKELYEVNYSMHEFIEKEDFFKEGKPNVTKARKAFVRALIKNELKETYASVMRRIEELLFILLPQEQAGCIVISHGFFLKILEAYTLDSSIKKYPNKLLKYFSGDTETFHFGEGFLVDSTNNQYTFNKYIKVEGFYD